MAEMSGKMSEVDLEGAVLSRAILQSSHWTKLCMATRV